MLTIVSSPERVGYGFDTDFHDWNDILKMYPDCSILAIDIREEYPLQYPPIGCRVFGWNKDDNFRIGDVNGDMDVERFHTLFDGIKKGKIMELNTKYRTKEEFEHKFDGCFAFGEYVPHCNILKLLNSGENEE